MAQICLAYLLDPTLLDGILDGVKLRDFPFAHLAAVNWYHYYRASEEGKVKAEELLLRLFQNEKNSFLTWVRLYEIDCPWRTNVHFDKSIEDIGSPTYYASFLGLEVVLKTILTSDDRSSGLSVSVHMQGEVYGNALQAASLRGHKEVVQMLLHQVADVNAQGRVYGNALQAASSEGHKEVVQILLDRGADVNAEG
jgi:hypothetical protein